MNKKKKFLSDGECRLTKGRMLREATWRLEVLVFCLPGQEKAVEELRRLFHTPKQRGLATWGLYSLAGPKQYGSIGVIFNELEDLLGLLLKYK